MTPAEQQAANRRQLSSHGNNGEPDPVAPANTVALTPDAYMRMRMRHRQDNSDPFTRYTVAAPGTPAATSPFGTGGAVIAQAPGAAAGGAAAAPAPHPETEEEKRAREIREGRASVDQALSGFNDDYFQNIINKYTANYIPQLDTQFRDAHGLTVKNLARQHLLSSSIATGQLGDMTKSYDDERAAIAARGSDAADNARSKVTDAKIGLYNDVESGQAGADVAANARNMIGGLQREDAPSPLASVFSTFVNSANLGLQSEAAGYPGLGTGAFQRSRVRAPREVK